MYSLVGANTGSFQSLGAQLFVLVGNQVDAERELINVCALSAKIEDTNLRVRYTTVESGLWVGLETKNQPLLCTILKVPHFETAVESLGAIKSQSS